MIRILPQFREANGKKPIEIDIAIDRDDKRVSGNTTRLMKLACLILLIPKYRRIFKRVITKIDFKKLQFDEDDRYFCLNRSDYKFFGEDIDTRMARYREIHKDGYPPMVKIERK